VLKTVRDIWDELSTPPTLLVSGPNTMHQLSSCCYPDERCLSECMCIYVYFYQLSGVISSPSRPRLLPLSRRLADLASPISCHARYSCTRYMKLIYVLCHFQDSLMEHRILTHSVSQPARLHLMMSGSDSPTRCPHKHVRGDSPPSILFRLVHLIGRAVVRNAGRGRVAAELSCVRGGAS